ncbi:DeoR/GlpR family DNA-binding transcription regulator [Allopusillimonas ginsengisoli]|uniref:DeoR/GlpR family DNA-binding transcription regulator n=1 Tax=Allopusillimonas ginsengisoli TaxID=453575 RepID=UPI001430A287|nr:DeoR/GlpR family DNA-binding transcription regulator [Allopusillimonas ginsengisoli]
MNQSTSFPPAASELLPRQLDIVQCAKQHGFVTIDALAERLGVTTQTIRRDINYLCSQGILSRFHGGAAFRSSIVNLPYETRRDSLSREKTRIAMAVAAEVRDETSVFIDIGTTAEAVAMQLVKKRNMRVVTNNLNVVDIMRASEGVEIIVSGGSVRVADRALAGVATADFIRQFHLDYAVLGVVAISRSGDILDFTMEEEPVTQAILGCARNAYVVADHSKFDRNAMVKVAHVSQASAVVTDALPDEGEWLRCLSDAGARVIVAPM